MPSLKHIGSSAVDVYRDSEWIAFTGSRDALLRERVANEAMLPMDGEEGRSSQDTAAGLGPWPDRWFSYRIGTEICVAWARSGAIEH